MQSVMAKRPRFVIDTDEDFRRAVALRAVRLGKKPNEVLLEILRRELSAELKEVKKFKRPEGEE